MFSAPTGQLTINGTDLATFGAVWTRSTGLFDGPTATMPTEPLAAASLGGLGHVPVAPRPLLQPREVTITVTVGADTFATLQTRLAALRAALGAASVTLDVTGWQVNRAVTGYVTRTAVAVADPQHEARVAEVTFTLFCPDPTILGAAQAWDLQLAATAIPVGTAPSVLSAVVRGPTTDPDIVIADSTGAIRARVAFTASILTGQYLQFDGVTLSAIIVDAGTSAVVTSAVPRDRSLPSSTATLLLRPEHVVGGTNPTIRTLAAVGGDSYVSYRLRYL